VSKLLLAIEDSHDPTMKIIKRMAPRLIGMAEQNLNGSHRRELLILTSEKQLKQMPPHPYVLVDGRDGAELEPYTRRALCGPNPPVAVWKNSVYADRSFYNDVDALWHAELARRAILDPSASQDKPEQIPEAMLGRISSPICFGCYERPQKVLERRLPYAGSKSERPIDVFFAGRVDYPDFGPTDHGSLITLHRFAAVNAIEALPSFVSRLISRGIETLSFDGYFEKLMSSKIVVSPYGFGETCFRDWEAIFAECLLIKPRIGHIERFPFHLECKEDFSDLENVVKKALRLLENPEVVNRMMWSMNCEAERCFPPAVGDAMWESIKGVIK
jgi:hypothetical protein